MRCLYGIRKEEKEHISSIAASENAAIVKKDLSCVIKTKNGYVVDKLSDDIETSRGCKYTNYAVIGKKVGGKEIYKKMQTAVRKEEIKMAILTVPQNCVQELTDLLGDYER